jgi:hypothetical protein
LGDRQVDFLDLRSELLVDHEHVIIMEVGALALALSLEDLLLDHEALDVLGAGVVIELHGLLDLLEGDGVLLIEHHQDAHLVSAQN